MKAVDDDDPYVSVVCPFLDVEPYFAEAIESVLAQSYGRWELLLVDDGSGDGSTEIAQQYACRHPDRIRYIAHDGRRNLGVSASRNLGVRHARGSWLASLDGDDIWLPRKLEEQVHIVRSHPSAEMVVGATLYWYSWTGALGDADRDKIKKVGASADALHQPPSLITALYPIGPGTAPSMNSILVRIDLVNRIGGWEDEFRDVYEDQAFLLKVYLTAPVYVASSCWDRYRSRPGSIMAKVEEDARYEAAKHHFLGWAARHLARQRITDPAIHRAVHVALLRHRLRLLARIVHRVKRCRRPLLSRLPLPGGRTPGGPR